MTESDSDSDSFNFISDPLINLDPDHPYQKKKSDSNPSYALTRILGPGPEKKLIGSGSETLLFQVCPQQSDEPGPEEAAAAGNPGEVRL